MVTTENNIFNFDEYFNDAPSGNIRFQAGIIGIVRKESDFKDDQGNPKYQIEVHYLNTKKQTRGVIYLNGYPAAHLDKNGRLQKLNPNGAVGQFVQAMNAVGVPLHVTTDDRENHFENLATWMDDSYMGKGVVLEVFNDYTPSFKGKDANFQIKKITLPVEYLGDMDEEALAQLRGTSTETETEEPSADETALQERLFALIDNKTVEAAATTLARYKGQFANASFFPQIEDGSLFALLAKSGRITVTNNVINVNA